MKWYNEDKTEMVDLDKVSQFKYNKVDDILTIICDGIKSEFGGDRAKRIYKLLTIDTSVTYDEYYRG